VPECLQKRSGEGKREFLLGPTLQQKMLPEALPVQQRRKSLQSEGLLHPNRLAIVIAHGNTHGSSDIGADCH